MIANDLKPGMDMDGEPITRVARRGTTVTVTVESGASYDLERWKDLDDDVLGGTDLGADEEPTDDLAATATGDELAEDEDLDGWDDEQD